MSNIPSLKDLLGSAQLPALPQSAIRLLELSQNPDNGPTEFAVPIEADPGLTGQVLKFVNSSYFGFSREISSIKLAITLVGIRTIKNFALWSAVFSLMPNPKCGPFDLKSLWQDSLRRGLFARAFGKLQGLKDAEDLFAAALLQDMAVPLLAKELPTQYVQLLEGRKGGMTRLSSL
jgi:HD-like signal output (HDOD) protein